MQWLLLAGIALVLVGLRRDSVPRGIRNNNPGNLVLTGIPWVGKVPTQDNTDGKFEQFVSPEYGIRALYKDVVGDIERDLLNTPRLLISEFAPSSENNTDAYVRSVAAQIGIGEDDTIYPQHYVALIKAIIRHENGIQPFTDDFIRYSASLTA